MLALKQKDMRESASVPGYYEFITITARLSLKCFVLNVFKQILSEIQKLYDVFTHR